MSGTVHAGVTGNNGIVFKLAEGIDPAVDYDGDVKKVEIVTEDKDENDLTFAEAAAGAVKDFKVSVTAIVSTVAGSLWRLLWDNPGAEFAFTYGPHGNAVPSVDKPHFIMTIKATGQPGVPQEAKRTKERMNFDYSFDVTVAPVMDDGS